jgi:protein-disulfide isomerase
MIKLNLKSSCFFFVKFFILYMIILFSSVAEEKKINNNLLVAGSDEAPVKIKIFSSLTCPHCANFHIKVVSQIEENYVSSGKVQLIFIDFPLDKAAFNASKLIYCLDEDKQLAFLDTIYKNQNQWTSGENINEIDKNLKKLVSKFGMNETQFNKCLIDDDIADRILNDRIDGQKKYSISSTPTIIINEKKLEGSNNFKSIKKIIEKLI